MNYPDKEKRMEKHSEKMESIQRKLDQKMKEEEERKAQTDALEQQTRVGKLAWSKEEEEERSHSKSSQERSVNAAEAISSRQEEEKQPAEEMKQPVEETKPLRPTAPPPAEEYTSAERETASSRALEEHYPIETEKSSAQQPFQRTARKSSSVEKSALYTKKTEALEKKEQVATKQVEEETVSTPEGSKGNRAVRLAFKILWLPLLLLIVFIVGLMIGHSVIGKQPALEIFDPRIWQHLYDLIYG